MARPDHSFVLTRWTWINFFAGVIVGAWILRPLCALIADFAHLVAGQIGK